MEVFVWPTAAEDKGSYHHLLASQLKHLSASLDENSFCVHGKLLSTDGSMEQFMTPGTKISECQYL